MKYHLSVKRLLHNRVHLDRREARRQFSEWYIRSENDTNEDKQQKNEKGDLEVDDEADRVYCEKELWLERQKWRALML